MNKTSDVINIHLGGNGLGCGERIVIMPRSVSMLVIQIIPVILLVTTVVFRFVFKEFEVALSFSNSIDDIDNSW